MTQQKSIDKENMRLLGILKNTDSRLMQQLDLRSHNKKINERLQNIGNWPKVKMVEEMAQKAVWKEKSQRSRSKKNEQNDLNMVQYRPILPSEVAEYAKN